MRAAGGKEGESQRSRRDRIGIARNKVGKKGERKEEEGRAGQREVKRKEGGVGGKVRKRAGKEEDQQEERMGMPDRQKY